MSKFMDSMFAKAKAVDKHILLSDGIDDRAIQASRIIVDQKIARISLIGNADEINSKAKTLNVSLNNVNIIDPVKDPKYNEYVNEYLELRKNKGMTLDKAKEAIANPLFFGGMLLRHGLADGSVAGSLSTTADVIRSGLHTVGVQKGINTVSSFFVMVLADGRLMGMADCAVLPNPDANQLADIAISTAENFAKLTGEEARVAMLSFSTYGSAEHELVTKVQEATKAVKSRAPHIKVDGEMQADAAIVAKVAEKKCPNSPIAGKANVLIFPDLSAGNIGYKLVQRLAGAEAIGPMVQGLAKPAFDLSRGCSVEDIVSVTAINCAMS